jgi:sRNA-binding carbon storage regulator CsrA
MPLSISRLIGEKLVLKTPGQEPIEVMVARVSGKKVTLAIAAPAEVRIARSELVATSRELRPLLQRGGVK